MEFAVVSLFPELIMAASSHGVCGRAAERGLIQVRCTNPRDFAPDAHRTVDDRPYGGGPGMVLKVEPFRSAIESAKVGLPEGLPVVFLGPQGRVFNQTVARELVELPGMILVAGRYEGFDERLIESIGDDEISLGDFVLSGAEIAAAAIIDAVTRLLPGVLGDDASSEQDSFSEQLFDCPHYTRPEILDGMQVPQVLMHGNHREISRWRLKQALGRTWARRPELLAKRKLTADEEKLLKEYKAEASEAVMGRR